VWSFSRRKITWGQLHLAARVPHKEEFLDVIRHQELEARKAGADIRLGRKVTKEEVEAEDPDAVVLATGGIPLPAAFPGLEDTLWALASDVLDGLVEVATPSVLLVGGGLVGLEAADYLSARGIRVVLVEMLEEVGTDLDPLPRTMLLKRLEKQGVKIHTGTRILRVGPGEAVVEKEGEEARLPCETLILAVGVEPNRQLAEDLADSGMKLHVVGDARDPRGAGEAIWEGFQVGNAL
jgi:NADPH-dependent 2,4-dienoyl-CoA reductase/sulfur reductase-like enzyme